ncbi:TetR/AcrR family transcriptional regulator [Roseateles sp.]|uniref:TetR/AcrR family transcriptional regulator n=1 Tax=Roseateles sp. TaxID=1971397 RepID=UPI003D0B1847
MLGAALASFNSKGIEATGIEDLKRDSAQSVGTIYHHFKNKEGVVAALFFLAFDDQSRAMAEGLAVELPTRSLLRSLVSAYLRWTCAQPELARFILMARDVITQGPCAQELAQRLERRYGPIDARLSEAMSEGEIRTLPDEIVPALVLGPAESYCRGWLSGYRKPSPAMFESEFGDAAWHALRVQD